MQEVDVAVERTEGEDAHGKLEIAAQLLLERAVERLAGPTRVRRGEDLRLVTDTMRLAGGGDVSAIEAWSVPVFPVDGDDLIALGMRQGLEMGTRMKRMRQEWIASDYVLTADELIRKVPT